MNLLFIGDVFASPGRRIVAEQLNRITGEQSIDLIVANAENAAGGFGLTPAIAQELFAMGIDVLTTGNHIWDKREVYDYLDREERVLRPVNYGPHVPGHGYSIVKARNGVRCAVINLQGRVHMAAIQCPFEASDALLATLPPEVTVRFVDFHAEATSEKVAMGWHLDGRVTAVIGTHTHIPTADARLLPGGTAYLTDCGMTGAYLSVIGVEHATVLKKFRTQLPMKFEPAKGWVELHAVVVSCDETTGRATAIRPYVVADR